MIASIQRLYQRLNDFKKKGHEDFEDCQEYLENYFKQCVTAHYSRLNLIQAHRTNAETRIEERQEPHDVTHNVGARITRKKEQEEKMSNLGGIKAVLKSLKGFLKISGNIHSLAKLRPV